MKRAILLAVSLLAVSCATHLESKKLISAFEIQIESTNIDAELARTIALKYLSNVSSYDYDGKPISVEFIGSAKTNENIYSISHFGNGCIWGSTATQICTENKCTYNFTAYNEGPIICE